jgi:hypothetical protein
MRGATRPGTCPTIRNRAASSATPWSKSSQGSLGGDGGRGDTRASVRRAVGVEISRIFAVSLPHKPQRSALAGGAWDRVAVSVRAIGGIGGKGGMRVVAAAGVRRVGGRGLVGVGVGVDVVIRIGIGNAGVQLCFDRLNSRGATVKESVVTDAPGRRAVFKDHSVWRGRCWSAVAKSGMLVS